VAEIGCVPVKGKQRRAARIPDSLHGSPGFRLRPFDTHCHPGIEASSTAHIRKIVMAAKTKSASSILRTPASQVAEAIRNSAW
jgi:hypothetical protein